MKQFNQLKKFIPTFLLILMCVQKTYAEQYSVDTGKSIDIHCTADAPSGGWITHAFFELDDPNDEQYVALFSHSSELYATVTGISAKTLVKILVTYTYSYYGKYDDKVHVGHGTYYDYVTVKGGGVATDIHFNPEGVDMKVGETVKVKIEITPENTSSTYEWDVISTLSSAPSAYKITEDDNILSIRAKRKMSLFLIAETSNGLKATCVIYAKDEEPDDAVSPTDISITPETLIMREGDIKNLYYTLTPSYASTTISWASADEDICNISTDGEVTAQKSGQTIITATTSNGLQASCHVTVGAQLQKVTLPSTAIVTLGYQIRLLPEVSPEGALAEWQWASSNEEVASVDANGIITARKEGNAKIIVKDKENKAKSECIITVSAPAKGTDIRNVNKRIQSIEKIIEQALRQRK